MSKSTLTRRALVASTAAVPAAAALGLPAVAHAAAEPDPIFAVIEAQRRMPSSAIVLRGKACWRGICPQTNVNRTLGAANKRSWKLTIRAGSPPCAR
jgi:hypothetical protein